MRFMELIRRRGSTCLIIFLAVFLVSLFAGLTISGMSLRGCQFEQPQQQGAASSRATLVPDEALAKTVMSVNGREVDEQLFFTKLDVVLNNARQGDDDPALPLYAYGAVANFLVNEEVSLGRGMELGVKVTGEDINEARETATSQYMGTQESSTGNVLGDLAQRLGSQRERKAAFNEFLERQGLTEQTWLVNVRRELLIRKTREAWQAELDAAKALEAAETRAIIDQRLADGESFEALSLELSEDPAGGAQAVPLSRGIMLPEQEEALFSTAEGELTDWIEIPAGWNRFEVVKLKLAEGEEFEAEKPKIVANLKEGSDDEEYEPSHEEIAQQYEQVTARQILLKTSVPGGVDEALTKLVEAAQVEINDPIIMAYQALSEGKLQPPTSMGYDELVGVASVAAIGEDYDFGLIEAALNKGRGGAMADEAPATDEDAGEAADEADADSAEAPADDEAEAADEEEDGGLSMTPIDPATGEEPEVITPIYALAVGLFQLAIQQDEDNVGWFPYYMTGRVYLDWLDDTDRHDKQPIDRELARQEIETSLARAAEGREYSYLLHAARGLNLAWLERSDEALASLEAATKYAPHVSSNPVWETLREAYEVLDAQDKLEELDAQVAEFRQAELQAMIEQQQSQQPPAAQSVPITIPAGGDDEEPAADTDAEAEDGEPGEGEDTPPADEAQAEDDGAAEE